MITTNYGLAGGTLDNTAHLEAGARALLTRDEFTHWFEDAATKHVLAKVSIGVGGVTMEEVQRRQARN